MARKKNAKGLFEIIGPGSAKAGKSLGVPGWFGQAGPAPGPAPAEAPPSGVGPGPSTPVLPPARPAEPVLSAAGGRLRISLNQVSALVLLAVLIGLIILAFILGRRSGMNAAAATIEEVRAGVNQQGGAASGPHVLPRPGSGDGAQEDDLAGLVPDNFVREKGKFYLVIQDLVWNPEEAEDIKLFLYRDHNIKATIVRMARTRTYRIWDTKGFDSERSREALEYKAHVEQRVGPDYRNRGKRYDFRKPWYKPQ